MTTANPNQKCIVKRSFEYDNLGIPTCDLFKALEKANFNEHFIQYFQWKISIDYWLPLTR